MALNFLMKPFNVAFWAFLGPFFVSLVIFVTIALRNTITSENKTEVWSFQVISVLVVSFITYVIASFAFESRLQNLSFNAVLSAIFSFCVLALRADVLETHVGDYAYFALYGIINVIRLFGQSLLIATSKNGSFVKEKLTVTFFTLSNFLYLFLLLLSTIEYFVELHYFPGPKVYLRSFPYYEHVTFISFCVSACLVVVVFFIQSRQAIYYGKDSIWFKVQSFLELFMAIFGQIFVMNPISLMLSVIFWFF